MSRGARLLAGALLAAMPLLSGCVAAAIPVLAAGGVLRTQVDGKESATRSTGEPRVSIDMSGAPPTQHSAATREYTLIDGTKVEIMTGPTGQAAPAVEPAAQPLAPPQPAPASPAAGKTYTLADGTRAQIIGGALPAPTGPAAGPAGFASYDPLRTYAETQGTMPVVGSERHSAILAAPGTLAPETASCSVHPAALLVDLDPGAAIFDPAVATHADPGLARTLAALREQGVAIAWISANTADRAGAIRRALKSSGLDTDGHDELALLRYPEERKQTRREDLAKEYCVVAIAGDERGDFDELFQYLRDPAAAAPLEPLIGNGWFLIPQPLN